MAKKLFSLTPAQDNLLVPKTTTSNLTTDNKTPKIRGLRNSNITTSSTSTLGITNTNCTLVSGDTTINVCSDKCVNVFVTENISEQKYIKNVEGSGSLCVGTINTSNVYTNIVNSVCKLGFDTDSGFEVTDLGSGLAKIGMNSTFKYWEVNGSSGLTACGLDIVNFVAGSGVTITSDNNAVPKSLTISATGGGGSPGGSNCQFQYNNSGSFAGASGLTYNNSTGALGMTRIDVPAGESLEINVSNTNAYWYSLYGDIVLNTQDDYSSQVVYDSLGNAYIVGADGDNGFSPYLAKYDKYGTLLWQKIFTEINDNYKTGDAVAVDNSNNVYCLIGTDDAVSNDITIFKLTSSGTLVWQTTYTSSDYFAGTDLVVDNSGNVFACLYYSLGGDDQQLILKVDNTGAIQWQKALSGGGDGYPQGITLDSVGNVIISGQIYNEPANELLIAKYNTSGALQWQKQLMNPEAGANVSSGQLTTDSSNNIYVTGYMNLTAGFNKIYVAKLDSTGTLLWQTNLDGAGYQYSYGIALDSSNNVYICGTGDSSLGPGYFLMAKFDNSGVIQWQRIFGAGNEEQYYYWSVKTIDVYDDSYIVTGYTNTVPFQTFNGEAITVQLPTDGSLIGTYGNFTYQASNFTVDNNTFTSQSGTAIETDGALVSNPGVYTVVDGSNSNTLLKISGGDNTFTFNSNGSFSTSGFTLPTTYGGNGQALLSCNGNLLWGNVIPKLNGSCSIAIRKTDSTITGYDNIAIGEGTLGVNYPSSNIAIGTNAIGYSVCSIDNVAIGCQSQASSTSNGSCKNTSIGNRSLANVSGSCNVAVGYGSLYSNAGYENVAVGTNSMCSTGFNRYQNVALGNSTLMYGGNFNVAIGDKSSQCMNSLAQNNVSIGARAMQYGGDGMFNIAMGTCAMNNAVGNANIAIGKSSLKTVCCGCNNIAIGCHAIGYGYNNVGSNNIGIGESALSANNTGNQNVAIGHMAMAYSRDGCDNIAIGQRALGTNLTTGSCNIAIGYYALNLASDSMNIGIGYSAGCSITTGTNNTIIGSLTGSAGLVCTVLIGAGTCERIRVDDNGLCINGSLFTGGGVSSLNTLTGAVTLSGGTNVTIGSSGGTLTICSSGGSPSLDAYCSFDVGDGLSTSTGLNNIAIGCCTMFANTTGNNNIGFGFQALQCNTNGITNFAAGRMALRFNTGGGANTAIGPLALYGNKTGSDNIAIGSDALRCNQSGYGNVALGKEANLYGCSNNNIALGHMALRDNNDGNGNIAMGCCAMKASEGGLFNLAIGCKTLANNGASCHHVAIGSLALASNSTGQSNIAIGLNALTANTVGSLNIGIGCLSGCSITTGNNNTIIGTLAGSAGLVCTVLIAAGTCERIKVDDNGLCINGSPFSGGSGVTSVATSGSGLGFSLGGGTITTTGTVSLTVPSASDLSTCLQGDGLSGTSVGYRVLPQNSQSADYVLVAADSGKHLLHPSSDANARTFTIPANSSVAYPIGTSITFINETSQVLTISITSDTMYLAGSGLTGSRTLSQYGVATAIKTGSTTWYISGTGLT